ncbi:hypothetical protein L873DRAFT_1906862 [Choiromyces venosus 120613-1]|uniref:Uncharacterized protein n=1 Tax=Choiromyces venosus 120613-1 TaxID=1336337 RepID=A0A3N4JM71_9PEZI|nr:hypothetical protein L873DRAFT_1906862 [Choiromyces venosus 120613-1]
MSLGNGQNSDGTGIGDSQHATSQELPRRVCFSCPIATFAKRQEIPGMDSGNFTPEQTQTKPTPRGSKGKEKALENEGGLSSTLALLILIGEDGETVLDLSTLELIEEHIGSSNTPTTNTAVAVLLTTLKNLLPKRMNEMEARIIVAIGEKGTRQRTNRTLIPAQTYQIQPGPTPTTAQKTNPREAPHLHQQQQAQH